MMIDRFGMSNVDVGGLFRCCLLTMEETDTSGNKPNDIVVCKYCKALMVLGNDGVWRWHNEKD